MERKHDMVRDTRREVMAGIAVCGFLELLICVLFIGGGEAAMSLKLRSMAGILLGCLLAAGWFVHMEKSLREAVAVGEKGASFQIRKGYAFRMLAAVAVFLVAAVTDVIPVLAVLAGVLTLKPAAYLQPLFHKIFLASHRKGEET